MLPLTCVDLYSKRFSYMNQLAGGIDTDAKGLNS